MKANQVLRRMLNGFQLVHTIKPFKPVLFTPEGLKAGYVSHATMSRLFNQKLVRVVSGAKQYRVCELTPKGRARALRTVPTLGDRKLAAMSTLAHAWQYLDRSSTESQHIDYGKSRFVVMKAASILMHAFYVLAQLPMHDFDVTKPENWRAL